MKTELFVYTTFISAGFRTASLRSSAQKLENSKWNKISRSREDLSFKRVSSTTRNEISDHLGLFLNLSSHVTKLFTQNLKGQDECKRKTKGSQTTLIRSSKRLDIKWVFLETSSWLSCYITTCYSYTAANFLITAICILTHTAKKWYSETAFYSRRSTTRP